MGAADHVLQEHSGFDASHDATALQCWAYALRIQQGKQGAAW
jgi:hypothetical protein